MTAIRTVRYQVHATHRGDDDRELEFVVNVRGFKDAWFESRRRLKKGLEVQLADDQGTAFMPEAGAWTVRGVQRLDVPKAKTAPTEVTAVELVNACRENGVTVSRKIEAMLEAMREARGLAAGSTDVWADNAATGEGAAGEAAPNSETADADTADVADGDEQQAA